MSRKSTYFHTLLVMYSDCYNRRLIDYNSLASNSTYSKARPLKRSSLFQTFFLPQFSKSAFHFLKNLIKIVLDFNNDYHYHKKGWKMSSFSIFVDSFKNLGGGMMMNDMEFKFDKNNQLKVRLAIVESQLKFANKQIKILKNKDLELSNKSIGLK